MSTPEFEFVPLFAALPRGMPTSLDVLVRIRSPEKSGPVEIPPLNLAVVLDVSGSMAGEKLEAAKAAARGAVALLGSRDRLHLAAFSDGVETLAANASHTDRDALLQAIERLEAGGSTALHGGWARGVSLLQAVEDPQRLARVLLVSDGQANVGERRPDIIGAQVQRETGRGLSTSTLGVGLDFNEDLLETMARRGDGEYHFVESPSQLPAIFEAEVRSLTRTYGRRCSVGLSTGMDTRIVDVLNDLDRTSHGKVMIPNLVHGRTLELLVRLEVHPSIEAGSELLRVRLAFDDVEGGGRTRRHAALTLPVVDPEVFHGIAPHPEVLEQVLLLEAARIKRRAVEAIDQGDLHGARRLLRGALEQVGQAPTTQSTELERSQLQFLLHELEKGESASTRKHSHAQTYVRQRGRKDPGELN